MVYISHVIRHWIIYSQRGEGEPVEGGAGPVTDSFDASHGKWWKKKNHEEMF